MIKIPQISTWFPARYGKTPLIWSFFLIMFVWEYLKRPPSFFEGIFLALTLVVFFPIYILSFWYRDWRVAVCLFSLVGMGLAWANLNPPGASCLLIFAAGMSARFYQLRHQLMLIFTCIGVVAFAVWFWNLPPSFWVSAAVFSFPSAIGVLVAEVEMDRNSKLLRKQEEVEHLAALAERERISRDMHDLLGHSLSLISLKAELARKLFERDPVAAKQEIMDVEQAAREALTQVRAAVLGYRETGLLHELRGAKNVFASMQIQFNCQVDEALMLPMAVENILALALREATTNIIRHSHATACTLSLKKQGDHVHFYIADNGFENLSEKPKLKLGNGLVGMQERVRALGGQFAMQCNDGVSIDIRLALKAV
jgi:two-component system sensor histidine kinase DesK